MMNLVPSRLSLLLLLFFFTVALATVSVSAKMPDEVKTACSCFNGGILRSDVENGRCSCACSSPWAAPDCFNRVYDLVKVAITWENKSSDVLFSVEKTAIRLRQNIAGATTATELQDLSRWPRYEVENEVVVLYLVRASLVEQLLSDVSTQRAYLQTAPRAVDAWLVGKKTSAASLMSQYMSKGDVLGVHDLGFRVDVGGGSGKSNGKLTIVTAHIDIFVGALCTLVVCSIFEALLMKYYHPSETELDREHQKYSLPGQPMSKAALVRHEAMYGKLAAAAEASGKAVDAKRAKNPLDPTSAADGESGGSPEVKKPIVWSFPGQGDKSRFQNDMSTVDAFAAP